jgi:hypothetical protein
MAAPAGNHIDRFGGFVPPPGTNETVEPSSPGPGGTVPQTFTFTGTLGLPDHNLVSCDVNGWPAKTLSTDANGNCTAEFENVPVSYPNQVPLTARADGGGMCRIFITVGGPAAGTSCITLNPGTTSSGGFERKAIIIWLKRRDPPPGGFAFRLRFKGTPNAKFLVGGKLLVPGDSIKECYVGRQKAKHIVNRPNGDWYADFDDVPPDDYDLTATAKSGATDTVRVRIEVMP